MIDALKILKKYWKHTSFRDAQAEIIEAVLKKKDVVALLPTGGGKSICFQVPAMQLQGICIVISPLIALMQDQVANLDKKGIKAIALTSGLSQDDMITLFDNLQFGNYKFLYLSPERLQSPFIQDKIKQLQVSLIAVDEAHCISEWGHDFRPSYRNIKILRELKPETNFIALTASATPKVIEDISLNLELNQAQVFKKSIFRENLAYQLFSIEDKLHRLLQIATKTKAPIIVYVNSRNKTKDIANFLTANGFSSSFYHGGLMAKEKQTAFDNWMTEKTPIIVATNAFGMGIDKDNVKAVVHLDIPNSVENYLQEAGRAGRNGKKAFSVVLTNQNDIQNFKEKSEAAAVSVAEIKTIYKNLHVHFHIANGELPLTSCQFNLSEFSRKYKMPERKTQRALTVLQAHGVLELSKDFAIKSTLQFLVSSKQIIQHTKTKSLTTNLIQTILRSYGGVFEQVTNVDEYWLSQKTKLPVIKVIELLEQLHSGNFIAYKKASSNAELYFLVPREDNIAINRISKDIVTYNNQKQRKVEKILHFIENDTTCRSIQLLTYFNEKNVSECGICDVCLSRKKVSANITDTLITLLTEEGNLTSKEICLLTLEDDATVLLNLQQLLAEDSIKVNSYNQYYITK